MTKKKAKVIFKHNFFEIIEEGDHVLCAISGKEIKLENQGYNHVKSWIEYGDISISKYERGKQ